MFSTGRLVRSRGNIYAVTGEPWLISRYLSSDIISKFDSFGATQSHDRLDNESTPDSSPEPGTRDGAILILICKSEPITGLTSSQPASAVQWIKTEVFLIIVFNLYQSKMRKIMAFQDHLQKNFLWMGHASEFIWALIPNSIFDGLAFLKYNYPNCLGHKETAEWFQFRRMNVTTPT